MRYDPDLTGPRHLLEAVHAAGFDAEPYQEQRLGVCVWGGGNTGWAPRLCGSRPWLPFSTASFLHE